MRRLKRAVVAAAAGCLALAGTAVPAGAAPAGASGRCAGNRCVSAHEVGSRLEKMVPTAANLKRAATAPPARFDPVGGSAVSDLCASKTTNPSRFVSCSVDDWTVVSYTVDEAGEHILGTLPIQIRSSVTFDVSAGIPDWLLAADVVTGTGSGDLKGGVAGQIQTSCARDPFFCQDYGTGVDPIDMKEGTTVSFEYGEYDNGGTVTTAGVVDDLDQKLGVVLELATAPGEVQVDDASKATLWGRCDSVIKPGAGCVDEYGDIFVSFDAQTTPKIGPVANHVYTAEKTLPSHWGVPGTGSPLTRAVSDQIIDANRAAACPAGAVPAGLSCDEYPMAATYQGAASSARGDWSIAGVPKNANDSQGAAMTNFYDAYRVLDGDPFYVFAVNTSGAVSWP